MSTTKCLKSSFSLAIESSSSVGGIALGLGDDILETRSLRGSRKHATDLLPTIDALCRKHGVKPDSIGQVFVSGGPGSFTGLRIGITTARMLALAHGARIVSVPTLEVIAQNAINEDQQLDNVAVILDAKRGRVYAGGFERRGGLFVRTDGPIEVDPTEFLGKRDRSCAVLGEGVEYHRDAVAHSNLPVLPESLNRPRPERLYRLGALRAAAGHFDEARTLVPIYVRPPEAEEKWLERHGPAKDE